MKVIIFTTLVCACAPRARIVVPPESIRELAYMPTPDRYATSRHVIRMSDGTRGDTGHAQRRSQDHEVRHRGVLHLSCFPPLSFWSHS